MCVVNQLDDEARAENAAVIEHVAILVGGALPRHDAFERRRLEIGHPPLRAGEERDADGADAAVAPGLVAGPFDRIVEVDRLLRRIQHGLSRRLAGAALVDAHAAIAARHPPFRIDGLPVHVGIGLLLQVVRRHPELVLLVDAHVDQHGKLPVAFRPEDVGLEPGRRPASGCRRPSRASSCRSARTACSACAARLALARFLPTAFVFPRSARR